MLSNVKCNVKSVYWLLTRMIDGIIL